MRVIFMGAPEFAVPTLQEVVSNGHAVVAVYTRAPKPGGRRGLEIKKTPVHEAAEALGIPVFTPATLKNRETQTVFRSHAADVGLVIAYGLLLPLPVLEAPKLGCLNLHASLLPRWRGAAPIQRAVMAGDVETGVDLMRMDEGLDTGPVAMREVIPIRPEDTAGDLMHRMARVAAKLATSRPIRLGRWHPPFHRAGQRPEFAMPARSIRVKARSIGGAAAADVRNQIHGLSPVPGAYSILALNGRLERIKILRAEVVGMTGAPGTILDNEMTVACGGGAIRIVEGQRAGRIVMPGRELMRRESVAVGAAFMPPGKSSYAREAQT